MSSRSSDDGAHSDASSQVQPVSAASSSAALQLVSSGTLSPQHASHSKINNKHNTATSSLTPSSASSVDGGSPRNIDNDGPMSSSVSPVSSMNSSRSSSVASPHPPNSGSTVTAASSLHYKTNNNNIEKKKVGGGAVGGNAARVVAAGSRRKSLTVRASRAPDSQQSARGASRGSRTGIMSQGSTATGSSTFGRAARDTNAAIGIRGAADKRRNNNINSKKAGGDADATASANEKDKQTATASKKTPAAAPPPAVLRVTAPKTIHEINRAIVRLQDLIVIDKSEIALAADSELQRLWFAHRRVLDAKFRRARRKSEKISEVAQSHNMVMAKKFASLESVDEPAARDAIIRGERQHAESLLRHLERDLGDDVEILAHQEQLRVKYWQRTLAFIIKNEQTDRKGRMFSEAHTRQQIAIQFEKDVSQHLMLAKREAVEIAKRNQVKKVQLWEQSYRSERKNRSNNNNNNQSSSTNKPQLQTARDEATSSSSKPGKKDDDDDDDDEQPQKNDDDSDREPDPSAPPSDVTMTMPMPKVPSPPRRPLDGGDLSITSHPRGNDVVSPISSVSRSQSSSDSINKNSTNTAPQNTDIKTAATTTTGKQPKKPSGKAAATAAAPKPGSKKTASPVAASSRASPLSDKRRAGAGGAGAAAAAAAAADGGGGGNGETFVHPVLHGPPSSQTGHLQLFSAEALWKMRVQFDNLERSRREEVADDEAMLRGSLAHNLSHGLIAIVERLEEEGIRAIEKSRHALQRHLADVQEKEKELRSRIEAEADSARTFLTRKQERQVAQEWRKYEENTVRHMAHEKRLTERQRRLDTRRAASLGNAYVSAGGGGGRHRTSFSLGNDDRSVFLVNETSTIDVIPQHHMALFDTSAMAALKPKPPTAPGAGAGINLIMNNNSGGGGNGGGSFLPPIPSAVTARSRGGESVMSSSTSVTSRGTKPEFNLSPPLALPPFAARNVGIAGGSLVNHSRPANNSSNNNSQFVSLAKTGVVGGSGGSLNNTLASNISSPGSAGSPLALHNARIAVMLRTLLAREDERRKEIENAQRIEHLPISVELGKESGEYPEYIEERIMRARLNRIVAEDQHDQKRQKAAHADDMRGKFTHLFLEKEKKLQARVRDAEAEERHARLGEIGAWRGFVQICSMYVVELSRLNRMSAALHTEEAHWRKELETEAGRGRRCIYTMADSSKLKILGLAATVQRLEQIKNSVEQQQTQEQERRKRKAKRAHEQLLQQQEREQRAMDIAATRQKMQKEEEKKMTEKQQRIADAQMQRDKEATSNAARKKKMQEAAKHAKERELQEKRLRPAPPRLGDKTRPRVSVHSYGSSATIPSPLVVIKSSDGPIWARPRGSSRRNKDGSNSKNDKTNSPSVGSDETEEYYEEEVEEFEEFEEGGAEDDGEEEGAKSGVLPRGAVYAPGDEASFHGRAQKSSTQVFEEATAKKKEKKKEEEQQLQMLVSPPSDGLSKAASSLSGKSSNRSGSAGPLEKRVSMPFASDYPDPDGRFDKRSSVNLSAVAEADSRKSSLESTTSVQKVL